jgi:flagellar biosynthesis/type III secretory pathway protein FliH
VGREQLPDDHADCILALAQSRAEVSEAFARGRAEGVASAEAAINARHTAALEGVGTALREAVDRLRIDREQVLSECAGLVLAISETIADSMPINHASVTAAVLAALEDCVTGDRLVVRVSPAFDEDLAGLPSGSDARFVLVRDAGLTANDVILEAGSGSIRRVRADRLNQIREAVAAVAPRPLL